jgi:NAD(P)-dependent dehydrogenase (short-subunit alcohol dehydrogenase family)
LAKQGATIIFACRNKKKTTSVIQQIQNRTNNKQVRISKILRLKKLHFVEIDLSDMKSIEMFHQQFKEKFGKLDILINNAAIISRVENKANSAQGYELAFGTNHLGHHLLTRVN